MVSKVPKFSVSSHKQSRNAFDLSQSHIIQAAPGQLLPIFNINLIPDDSVKINVTDFVKSMPVMQSPLCDARGVYEFFFVPYHQLWHNFDQFITQMNDYRSTAFAVPNPPASVPAFTTKRTHKVGNSTISTFVGSPLDLSLALPEGQAKCQTSYLYDLLGYCPFVDSEGKNLNLNMSGNIPGNTLPDYSLNLFSLAAYNKIYQDWYRKTSYEAFDVSSYSLDSLPSADWFMDKLTIHQRNYGLDLLTNLRPSAGLNVNGQSVFDNILPQMFGTDKYSNIEADYNGLPSSNTNTDSTGVAFWNTKNDTLFSVSSIRAAFALDKLSQIIGRAEKDYKSQMKAVYGADVTTGRDGKCIFIDGFSSDISFGEVDNTNGDTYGGSDCYSTYGKVFGSGNGSITFKSPEFGILMCIYSIIPFVPYDSTKVDLFNTKHTYQDYFNPLYQHLGLQPIYKGQISCLTGGDANPLIKAYGWQPRYSEYKTAIDTNHGSFINSGPLRSFTSSRVRTVNPYANVLQLSDLKISPSVFDSVFTMNFDNTLNSYPFFNKVSFNVIKVSSMDADSLPLL